MQTGRELDKRNVMVPEIKTLGSYDASGERLSRSRLHAWRAPPRVLAGRAAAGAGRNAAAGASLFLSVPPTRFLMLSALPRRLSPLPPSLPCSQAAPRGDWLLQGCGRQGHVRVRQHPRRQHPPRRRRCRAHCVTPASGRRTLLQLSLPLSAPPPSQPLHPPHPLPVACTMPHVTQCCTNGRGGADGRGAREHRESRAQRAACRRRRYICCRRSPARSFL